MMMMMSYILKRKSKSFLITHSLFLILTVDVDVSMPVTNPLRAPETKHLRYDLHAKLNPGATMPSTDAIKFDMTTSAQPKGLAVVNAEPPSDEPQDGPFSEARMLVDPVPAKMPTKDLPKIHFPGTQRLYDLTILNTDE